MYVKNWTVKIHSSNNKITENSYYIKYYTIYTVYIYYINIEKLYACMKRDYPVFNINSIFYFIIYLWCMYVVLYYTDNYMILMGSFYYPYIPFYI